jgi:hypothetical protein
MVWCPRVHGKNTATEIMDGWARWKAAEKLGYGMYLVHIRMLC